MKSYLFEAPAPTPDRGETHSNFSKDSTKFSMYHFTSLPLQEERFCHASLLMILHFHPLKVHFDFFMGQYVGNPTVAIE
jgi:hypothetical protein